MISPNQEQVRLSTKAFLDQQRSSHTGLIESFARSSRFTYEPTKNRFEEGTKEYLEKQCFTYDGALAAIAYALVGDFQSAQSILKTFEHNFHYAKGERIGLFNAYRIDDYADSSRLLAMGIDGDRMHTGPNIWVGLAAFHYTMISGDRQFFPLFLEIIKWVMHRVPHDVLKNQARAGVSMGSGWGHDWGKIFSTEHNIDYFAILNLFLMSLSDPTLQDLIKTSALRQDPVIQEQSAVLSWLQEKVFDANEGRFYMGTNEAGVDHVRALDTTSFAVLGIGPACLKANGIDPAALVANAESHLRVTVKVVNESVTGFDFTNSEGHGHGRPAVIWIEGTYQMALAYQEMAAYSTSLGDLAMTNIWNEKRNQVMEATERLTSLLVGKEEQIPSYTSAMPKATEVLKTFKEDWEIQRGDENETVKSVASAVWKLFAVEKFNPMSFKAETQFSPLKAL